MNRSAGAPLSTCLASVELAAYEILACAPPCRSNSLAASSSALVRLAAANTTTSCARAACPGPNAISAVASAARLLDFLASLAAKPIFEKEGFTVLAPGGGA